MYSLCFRTPSYARYRAYNYIEIWASVRIRYYDHFKCGRPYADTETAVIGSIRRGHLICANKGEQVVYTATCSICTPQHKAPFNDRLSIFVKFYDYFETCIWLDSFLNYDRTVSCFQNCYGNTGHVRSITRSTIVNVGAKVTSEKALVIFNDNGKFWHILDDGASTGLSLNGLRASYVSSGYKIESWR